MPPYETVAISLYFALLLGLLSSCLAFPPFPPQSWASDITLNNIKDHPPHSSREKSSTSRLHQRSTISDLLSDYYPLLLPPNRLTNHITIIQYIPFLPSPPSSPSSSNASTALSSFYSAIASRSAQLITQNEVAEQKMAFGAKRFWINFYKPAGQEEGAIQWRDVQWLAEKCRGWAQRGLVGKWEGWLFLEGGRGSVRVEVRVYAS
ncbi:MAG: hypothetical protein LQ346_006806 [Caloplaca aetnensis]|nr:MAG: hypothetical protein LQ346_006806 [Caloplaca aetnensis]